jgi:hypothetical protein
MSTSAVIIVEYTPMPDVPETPERLAHLKRCLGVREATLLRSYRSLDGTKLVRVFEAPDAGAVRYAHASSGYTNVTIWAAEERDTP